MIRDEKRRMPLRQSQILHYLQYTVLHQRVRSLVTFDGNSPKAQKPMHVTKQRYYRIDRILLLDALCCCEICIIWPRIKPLRI
jgi:hypothetical protein